jgi:hypothetical protein
LPPSSRFAHQLSRWSASRRACDLTRGQVFYQAGSGVALSAKERWQLVRCVAVRGDRWRGGLNLLELKHRRPMGPSRIVRATVQGYPIVSLELCVCGSPIHEPPFCRFCSCQLPQLSRNEIKKNLR